MNRFIRQLLPFGTLILLIAALSALEQSEPTRVISGLL